MTNDKRPSKWSSRRFWIAVGSILLVTAISVFLYRDLRGLLPTTAEELGLAHQAFADLALALFLRWLGYLTLVVGAYLGIDQAQKRLYAGLPRNGGKP